MKSQNKTKAVSKVTKQAKTKATYIYEFKHNEFVGIRSIEKLQMNFQLSRLRSGRY